MQSSYFASTPYLPPNNIRYISIDLTISLLRTQPTRALPLLQLRPFSTSPYVSRPAIEGTKDVIDATNGSVGKGLKKGIETGKASVEAVKSTIGLNASEAERSAGEVAGEAKGKAQEVAGQAKGKASEVAGKAKGTASNATEGKSDKVIGEVKGKASELSGKAKGIAANIGGQAKGKAEEVKSKY